LVIGSGCRTSLGLLRRAGCGSAWALVTTNALWKAIFHEPGRAEGQVWIRRRQDTPFQSRSGACAQRGLRLGGYRAGGLIRRAAQSKRTGSSVVLAPTRKPPRRPASSRNRAGLVRHIRTNAPPRHREAPSARLVRLEGQVATRCVRAKMRLKQGSPVQAQSGVGGEAPFAVARGRPDDARPG